MSTVAVNVSVLEPPELALLGDLEKRLIARFSPPLRPDEVQGCLAEVARGHEEARIRTYLALLIERAAVDRLQAIVRRRTSQTHLVEPGGHP